MKKVLFVILVSFMSAVSFAKGGRSSSHSSSFHSSPSYLRPSIVRAAPAPVYKSFTTVKVVSSPTPRKASYTNHPMVYVYPHTGQNYYASTPGLFSPNSPWFWLYVMRSNGKPEQIKASCNDPQYKNYKECQKGW